MTTRQALHRSSFPVMGTTASVHVDDAVDEDAFEDAVGAFRSEMFRLESMFSVFRQDSEISRINAGTLHHLDASPEVMEVLDACSWLEQASGGAFSIRRSRDSAEINPSGFVKGWATERSSVVLSDAGFSHWYAGVGGDIIARGGTNGEGPWRVGIADPRDAGMLVGTAEIMDGAVATSGTAERGKHLWDPRTGEPATHFLSVTVTGPSLTWADAYATTVFVLGETGPAWLAQFEGYSVLPVR